MKHTSATSAMSIMVQDGISYRSSLKESVAISDLLLNWAIWVIGIMVSALPLFVLPFVKSLVQSCYNEWFYDFFNNAGIIIISVSLAVTTVLELIAGNRKTKFALLLGSFILFLILLGILAYGVVTGISEYAALAELDQPQVLNKLASLNRIFFVMMFTLSSVLFFVIKRRFVWN